MTQAPATIARLQAAINHHDLDALVACFAEDVRSEQPAHPARRFTGREQVRRNWAQIFSRVPDLRAELLSCGIAEGTASAEWSWTGTRADGGPFAMRGVTVLAVREEEIAAVRFYMEPVEAGGPAVEASIEEVVGR
jgi:ketosteroid isomerase-like protein